jgi:hypothetical protein
VELPLGVPARSGSDGKSIFGKDKITSGAQSDIEQATKLARAMVLFEAERPHAA